MTNLPTSKFPSASSVHKRERLDRRSLSGRNYPASTSPSSAKLTAQSHSERYTPAMGVEQEAPNRFAHDFVDPRFPCKTVPYASAKRALDMCLSCGALVVFGLPMALIAAGIKLTSHGPVLFKQVRMGRGGRHFWCYKFRSMCVDAEAKKPLLMHLNEASGPVFKIKKDPRITPIGGLLRKLSLDELPQLFNVLKGDMSIVGPRPPVPAEVEQYTAHHCARLAVLPGLTCLWQIGGRSNVSFERWVELDLLYIETMSFATDIRIVLKTIPAVILGIGAH